MTEECPTCGSKVLFTSTVCPHCQADRNRPDPVKAAQWRSRRPAYPTKKSLIVDDITPLREKYLQDAIALAPARLCTCGSTMTACQAAASFIFAAVPTGSYTLLYRCPKCQKSQVVSPNGAVLEDSSSGRPHSFRTSPAARAPIRRCSCGGAMIARAMDGAYLLGFLPIYRLKYQCQTCNLDQMIASGGDLLYSAGTGLVFLVLLTRAVLAPGETDILRAAEYGGWGLGALFFLARLVLALRARRKFPAQRA